MTVLVLKISQPFEPTLMAIFNLRISYISYFISFITIFTIWYNNHNLFQLVDEIDNLTVWLNGLMLFEISLLPYFTIWLSYNAYSIHAETMFGLMFISINITYNFAVKAVYRSNSYNKALMDANYDNQLVFIPSIIVLIGFILTYTVFIPSTYICCLLAIIIWIIIVRFNRGDYYGD